VELAGGALAVTNEALRSHHVRQAKEAAVAAVC